MTELEKQWQLNKPTFLDLKETLTACGRVVVREIIASVKGRRKPDGSPQKQNAPSTVKAKGHDHPVVEHRHRFEKPGTYRVEPRDAMSVMITIASPADSEIAARLEDHGYEFFGITNKADEEAYEAMESYLVGKVNEAFGGKP